MAKYAVYPGSVTTYDNELHSFTLLELATLYGVDISDCVNGWNLNERIKVNYIHLKPRKDGIYPNMPAQVDLGDEIKWGPDFDGKKKFTMETDFDALYAEQNAEEKL